MEYSKQFDKHEVVFQVYTCIMGLISWDKRFYMDISTVNCGGHITERIVYTHIVSFL